MLKFEEKKSVAKRLKYRINDKKRTGARDVVFYVLNRDFCRSVVSTENTLSDGRSGG